MKTKNQVKKMLDTISTNFRISDVKTSDNRVIRYSIRKRYDEIISIDEIELIASKLNYKLNDKSFKYKIRAKSYKRQPYVTASNYDNNNLDDLAYILFQSCAFDYHLKIKLYFKYDQPIIKRPCKYCGKPLTAIGNARKNGAQHRDWKSREYHKKCFKLI